MNAQKNHTVAFVGICILLMASAGELRGEAIFYGKNRRQEGR